MGRVKAGGWATCPKCGKEFQHPKKTRAIGYGGVYCQLCQSVVAREYREYEEKKKGRQSDP